MTITFVFGRWGAALVNIALAASLLGWYGVNMDLFSSVLQDLSQKLMGLTPSITAIEIVAGVLMTLTTLWGFKLIEKVSVLLVPVMVAVIVYMVVRSSGMEPVAVTNAASDLTLGAAISAVVGSFVVGAVLMPDFSRFARTRRDAVISSVLPFFVLSSFVYISAAYAGSVAGKSDALAVLLALGMGSLAFFLLVMSTWMTNVVNLYSASLGFNAVFIRFKEWQIILVAGTLGTIAASLNILEQFTDFLFGLSVIFVPVASIYVADFFIVRRGDQYRTTDLGNVDAVSWRALVAWAAGVAISLVTTNTNISITSIEACDALLVSFATYIFLTRLRKK